MRCLLVVVLSLVAVGVGSSQDALSVLVFSKTEAFRHDSIPDAVAALRSLGEANGWTVRRTEDAAEFNDDTLAEVDVVIFCMTTGDVFDSAQQEAFKRYVRSGKGYVGIHSASDTEHEWPWYGEFVGAYFAGHPEIQPATVIVEDRSHPATTMLPDKWVRTDEHYYFNRNPRDNVNVLMALDETTYAAGDEGAMGDHPIAWYQEFEGGRMFYTGLGHTKASYQDRRFLAHLEGAVVWAAAKPRQP